MPIRAAISTVLLCSLFFGCTEDGERAPEGVRSGESRSDETLTDEQLGAAVQEDVRALYIALYTGDLETVLDFTHPSLVKMLGGRENALDVLDRTMSPILERGADVESLNFPSAPDIVRHRDAVFAIVPTLTVVDMGGQRLESLNYQFGVLDSESRRWTYAEGSRITTETVGALFPDFPSGYEFPETYRKRL